MPAWITIYLKEKPEDLTAKRIQEAIDDADWWTLGEDFGLEEEEIDAFMDALHWQEHDTPDMPLSFGVPDQRPVQLHLWTAPERVAEEIEEITELEDVPEEALNHLKEVTAIVALEMGHTQVRTMHEVVAFEIAYWLCETHGGIIKSDDDRWFDDDEHRWDAM